MPNRQEIASSRITPGMPRRRYIVGLIPVYAAQITIYKLAKDDEYLLHDAH